jgi:tripartite-type tricarboxylate transporter receptor subunit TctC
VRALKILLMACAGLSAVAFAASAQEAEPKGKLVTVIAYTPPGSVYDLVSRMIARHMPQYLPGAPSMIVRNMPGAGGLTATRYLYSTAPKDGSVFGTVGRGIPFEPLLGGAGTVDFDPRKFTWLGSPSRESSLAIAWHTAAVKTADDLLSKELIIAGTGASADSEIIPRALNGIVGTKFKIISGYDGITKASLAMETGEIEGVAYWSWSGLKAAKMDLIRDGKIRLLFQSAAVPHPEIPDVPSAMTLAKTEAQRQALELLFARDVIAFPFFAPPGLPPDAAKQLTDAFAATLRDPALLAEAKQASVTIDPVSGEEALTVLTRVYDTPADVVASVRTAMGR